MVGVEKTVNRVIVVVRSRDILCVVVDNGLNIERLLVDCGLDIKGVINVGLVICSVVNDGVFMDADKYCPM